MCIMFFIIYINDEKEHSNRIMYRQYNAQNITLKNNILSIKWRFMLIILRINTFKLTIVRYFAFLMKIVDTIY